MIKIVELIIVATLLFFSFLAGVKYSDSVKSHLSWLFENKEEEIELPDLSNENPIELNAPAENLDDANKINAQDQSIEPNAVDVNVNPANNQPVIETKPEQPAKPVVDKKNNL